MNIQELHEKKKAFEMKLVEIIGKELSEFANEGVTITSIDVDFENVWPDEKAAIIAGMVETLTQVRCPPSSVVTESPLDGAFWLSCR